MLVNVNEKRLSKAVPNESESKFYVSINDEIYLLKDSSYNEKRKKPSLAPYCEHVASTFIRYSGLLNCQKTMLGQYDGRVVVLCKDIFLEGTSFRPMSEIYEYLCTTEGIPDEMKEYTFDSVLTILKKKEEGKRENYTSKFWLMFLFDLVLGNRDRHAGNWGFVNKIVNGTVVEEFCPIFDNGCSLFPDVDLNLDYFDYTRLKEATFHLPACQFREYRLSYERIMRTNYYEDFQKYSAECFPKELDMFRKMPWLYMLNSCLEGISGDIRNWFYCVIYLRFNCIIFGRNFDVVYKELKEDLLW